MSNKPTPPTPPPSFFLQIDHRAPGGEEFDGASHAPFEVNANFVELNKFSRKLMDWGLEVEARINDLEKRIEQLEEGPQITY